MADMLQHAPLGSSSYSLWMATETKRELKVFGLSFTV